MIAPEQFTTIAECGCKYQLVTINKDGAVLFDLRVTQCSLHLHALELYHRCESLLAHAEDEHQFYGAERLAKTVALLAKAMPPHMHVNNGKDDACRKCGKDLRDPIHAKGK